MPKRIRLFLARDATRWSAVLSVLLRAILAQLGLPTEPPRVASARGPPPDDGNFAQDTRGWEFDFNQDPGHDAPA